MGVPSYFAYLIRNHKEMLIKLVSFKKQINNLYFDSNSIIYDALRFLSKDYKKYTNKYQNDEAFEKDLIDMVCLNIENYINEIKPNKKVLIAFDGVAPVAKLEQQRTRRHKSMLEKRVMNHISGEKNEWNKTAITPGTNFMDKLNKTIDDFFRGQEKNVLDRLINSSSQFTDCQNIVRITGDNPLTDPLVLKKMILDHENNNYDHTFTRSIPIGTRAEVLSLDFLKFLSKNVIDKNNTEYLTFYFQKKLGQKNKNFFVQSKKISSGDSLTVDTIEDLEFIKIIFKELKNNIYASLDEIINTINIKNIIKNRSFLKNKTIDLNEFNLKNNQYE